jgi:hypothetical protein
VTRRKNALARIVLWIAASAILIGVGAVFLLPNHKEAANESDKAPIAANKGHNDDAAGSSDKTPADATPDHEDALRSHDSSADESQARVEVVGGLTTLRLDASTQARGGLRTEVLKPVSFSPEIAAFGLVADLQPLLAQRARYAAARSEADVARTTLASAKSEYDRLSSLNKEEGDIATKHIQQAEAEWKRNQAELRRFESEMQGIHDETRQQWGAVVTGWALDGNSPEFEKLLNHDDVLILVTLPPGQSLPSGIETVQIGRNGDRANAKPATYLSPAPATDPLVQGETHYFRAAADNLRAAMRLDVWIGKSKSAETGVIVPQSAVIWALGQAWAYVKTDDEHFVRRQISTGTAAPGGWFVADSIKPGDNVVVAGAQTLYAEEFRWQIRNEDN